MKPSRANAGFSLVEVMVALLVLGVAVVGLTEGIASALRSTKDSEWQTTAAFLAAGQIELLRADGFLVEGVSEGKGSGALAPYEWTESVTETPISGLFEVAVEVRRTENTAVLYELRTLLFDPPAGSQTNRPADSRDA
ncbi:MAG: prepilin-type N-terminal cleavage/methylation domain-containing protein, partial [Verrucomicrobiae bacterium]|nr:prepilin-type N-terminal cleavage/methylation domain-containing protein [Verrucomicrobiae bacterium]